MFVSSAVFVGLELKIIKKMVEGLSSKGNIETTREIIARMTGIIKQWKKIFMNVVRNNIVARSICKKSPGGRRRIKKSIFLPITTLANA